MRRILLIKTALLSRHMPSMVPPMGLLYLASVLRGAGFAVELLDCRPTRDPSAALGTALRSFEPDAVGISALTLEIDAAAELVALVKRWDPSLPVVVGGPHATGDPEDALTRTGADAVVVGEAETIAAELFAAMMDGAPLRLPGVLPAGVDGWPDVPRRAPSPVIDALPMPAWDLVDFDVYARFRSMSTRSPWRYATLVTTRGCPWRCTYCHNIQGKVLRRRSVESVADELRVIESRLGDGVVEILDDNFNADLERAKRILEIFCRTDGRLRPAFPNGVRVDRIDDEFLDLLVASRCEFISFAIESGSPEMQRRIKKNIDLEAARRAIEGAARRGLYTNGFFMLGFPGETLSEMLQTVRYSLSVPLTQALFFNVLAMPGTELYESIPPERRGDFRAADYLVADVNLSAEPDAVLAAVHRLAYVAFYWRPRTAWRLARSLGGLRRVSDLGFRLAHVLAGRVRPYREASDPECRP